MRDANNKIPKVHKLSFPIKRTLTNITQPESHTDGVYGKAENEVEILRQPVLKGRLELQK